MSVLSFKIFQIIYKDDGSEFLIFDYASAALDATNLCMRIYKEILKGELSRIPTILIKTPKNGAISLE